MKINKDKGYPSLTGISGTGQISVVKEIFSTITGKYDSLNHLLSLRRDVAWRRFAAKKLRFFEAYRFLDVATGTSDLAIEAALRYRNIRVVVFDFVQEMLERAKEKIEQKNLSERVSLFKGNALHIPTPSDTFDAAAIAFGIRNIPDKLYALKEMVRVVVPGGQVLVLEMTLPPSLYIRGPYGIYLNVIIPWLARHLSPNPRAYYYLGESIMNFPTPQEFGLLMEGAGLINIESYSLTLGISHLFVGHKRY